MAKISISELPSTSKLSNDSLFIVSVNSGNIYISNKVAYNTIVESLSKDIFKKIGGSSTSKIGSATKPIYVDNSATQILQASNANVGASDKPIYMKNGEFTQSNSTVGNENTIVFLQNGQFKAGNVAVNTTQDQDINANKRIKKALYFTKPDGTLPIAIFTNANHQNEIVFEHEINGTKQQLYINFANRTDDRVLATQKWVKDYIANNLVWN